MDVEASYSDFINCDRTGRRNAVPDITREGGQGPASTSELAKDMAEMDLKAAGKLTCRFFGIRRGPFEISAVPVSLNYYNDRGVLPFLGVVHISILTIVHYLAVISDFPLSHRRVSHDMRALINHTALLWLCGKPSYNLPSWPSVRG